MGVELNLKQLSDQLARLGYERVPLVETEGQWSRRGDIVDVFPVASELPVRLEWFGDELDQIREFDPSTQRSLDKIEQLTFTPTGFRPIVLAALTPEQRQQIQPYLSEDEQVQLENRAVWRAVAGFWGLPLMHSSLFVGLLTRGYPDRHG